MHVYMMFEIDSYVVMCPCTLYVSKQQWGEDNTLWIVYKKSIMFLGVCMLHKVTDVVLSKTTLQCPVLTYTTTQWQSRTHTSVSGRGRVKPILLGKRWLRHSRAFSSLKTSGFNKLFLNIIHHKLLVIIKISSGNNLVANRPQPSPKW